MLSNSVCCLLLSHHYDLARSLTSFLMCNHPLQHLLIQQLSSTAETSVLLFAAFSLKLIDTTNSDVLMNVSTLFKNHVQSEIEDSLEYEFRLNRDLMEVNDTEEEGLLFEIPDKSNVEADCKEKLLKQWIPREIELIKEIAQNI